MGVGASALPVSGGVTVGIVLKQDGYGYDAVDMQNAMQGLNVGFSFQGGVQGGLSVSPTGMWAGEVGIVTNAGIGAGATKTNYLFNIYDQ